MSVIIIQCSGRKKANSINGIKFVAQPQEVNEYHPDDNMDNNIGASWRQYIEAYNEKYQRTGENPYNLCKAGDLYLPNWYQLIIQKYGYSSVYILSAGWGLVRSDYLIPSYNITFALSAPKKNKRNKNITFKDWNQLQCCDQFSFFGGSSYLNLLYELTSNLKCRKQIHYVSKNIEFKENYIYIEYPKSFTNWHYQALKAHCL